MDFWLFVAQQKLVENEAIEIRRQIMLKKTSVQERRTIGGLKCSVISVIPFLNQAKYLEAKPVFLPLDKRRIYSGRRQRESVFVFLHR